jgi:hypothetical protein
MRLFITLKNLLLGQFVTSSPMYKLRILISDSNPNQFMNYFVSKWVTEISP